MWKSAEVFETTGDTVTGNEKRSIQFGSDIMSLCGIDFIFIE